MGEIAEVEDDPFDTGRFRAIVQEELRVSENRLLDALRHDRWKFLRHVRHAIAKFFGDLDSDNGG